MAAKIISEAYEELNIQDCLNTIKKSKLLSGERYCLIFVTTMLKRTNSMTLNSLITLYYKFKGLDRFTNKCNRLILFREKIKEEINYYNDHYSYNQSLDINKYIKKI